MNFSLRKSAFSLFEMLVAMSLFVILASLLLTLSNKGWQQWQCQQQQEQATSEALSLLQRMTRDLHSILLFPNSFFIDLPTRETSYRKNLFFLTTASSSKATEDVEAVGYFFLLDKKNRERYCCYRFVSPHQNIIPVLQSQRLREFFATVSPNDTTCCTLIASHIRAWRITPIWVVQGKMVTTPSEIAQGSSPPPSLLEISITTDNDLTPSQQRHKESTFSTMISLVP